MSSWYFSGNLIYLCIFLQLYTYKNILGFFIVFFFSSFFFNTSVAYYPIADFLIYKTADLAVCLLYLKMIWYYNSFVWIVSFVFIFEIRPADTTLCCFTINAYIGLLVDIL